MGRGASQNSRPESFPGVREKSLKKLISPTLPSLLVFFLPTPPPPQEYEAFRDQHNSPASKKPREL